MMRLGIIWNDRWQMTDWRVSSPSVWRGASFDRARLNGVFEILPLSVVSVCWQAAPANVS